MPSAMIMLGGALAPPPLATDLQAAGLTVFDSSDSPNFVQSVLANAPDLVILHQDAPDAAMFETATTVAQLAPRPIIVFTLDPDADNISRAMKAGVHAYIIDGYSPTRLRSVIHLAQARFHRDQLIKDELAQANQRFEERKLVDRAKGILMGTRQLREEEAYRVLRRVAMHTKQRIGQVAQRVIDAARYGEAINRAGQLRMLSQRLVKLYALTEAGIRKPDTAGLMADSIALVDDTIAILVRSLSKPTFGDLLEAVTSAWLVLKRMLEAPAQAGRFEKVDAAAEAVLIRSEQLTDNLEVSGFATALHVINVSGRQRMLSQRLAKAAILAAAFTGGASLGAHEVALSATTDLAEGLDYLRNLPLTNAAITAELENATKSWDAFQLALSQCGTHEGLAHVAELSEVLLGQFDQLTTHYERAMQAFVN